MFIYILEKPYNYYPVLKHIENQMNGKVSLEIIILPNCSERPWLRQLVAGLSPQRSVSVHAGSVVDKVALGEVSELFGFCHQYYSTVAYTHISSGG
jgi:hypothetical protein